MRRHADEERPVLAVSSVQPEADFVAFVRTVTPTLERLVRRLAPAGSDPFDLAAEALARTYARWPSLGEVENKRAWVLRVATNLAYDARARSARGSGTAGGEDAATGRPFEDEVADRELLGPALGRLPRRQRQAVALRYLADLPLVEVARVMGVSTETAKTHVDRGRQALRQSLGALLPQEVDDDA